MARKRRRRRVDSFPRTAARPSGRAPRSTCAEDSAALFRLPNRTGRPADGHHAPPPFRRAGLALVERDVCVSDSSCGASRCGRSSRDLAQILLASPTPRPPPHTQLSAPPRHPQHAPPSDAHNPPPPPRKITQRLEKKNRPSRRSARRRVGYLAEHPRRLAGLALVLLRGGTGFLRAPWRNCPSSMVTSSQSSVQLKSGFARGNTIVTGLGVQPIG